MPVISGALFISIALYHPIIVADSLFFNILSNYYFAPWGIFNLEELFLFLFGYIFWFKIIKNIFSVITKKNPSYIKIENYVYKIISRIGQIGFIAAIYNIFTAIGFILIHWDLLQSL